MANFERKNRRIRRNVIIGNDAQRDKDFPRNGKETRAKKHTHTENKIQRAHIIIYNKLDNNKDI